MEHDELPSALRPFAADVNGHAPRPVSRRLALMSGASNDASPILRVSQLVAKPCSMDGFIHEQKEKLIWLRDALIDSISLVARDHRESEGNRSQVPGFAGDEADAGSAALEQEFALQLLAQEHDALSEINEALRRIERGVYGVCETCAKAVPRARLEAIPFARLDVHCQAQVEKRRKVSQSRPLRLSFAELDLAEGEASLDDSATPETMASGMVR